MRLGRYFRKSYKKLAAACMVVALTGTCFVGCQEEAENEASILDPENPVSITVWHYYNGAQQNAFDALVNEFNATVGKEEGIYVQGVSQGTVTDLETAVTNSMAGKVGSDEMPNIFSSYADTAYEMEQEGVLANLSDYLTDDELDLYVDSYIDEGRIAEDDSLRIFPVAKSTEVMMINQTDWDKFAAENDVSLDQLKTIEGVVAVAEQYYQWTDAKTPEIANDGKAFYGRDSMANYFCIGMRQLGKEIFQVNNGTVTLNTDEELIRRLWDCYYVPMVKGYFAAYGSFRSDDVKTGDIIAYTGSTTSAMYFPDEVETEDERYSIDYTVMSAPIFEGGEDYAVQQGAGMVVTKTDEQHEYASVEFLKWFTQTENSITFCGDSGYLPVLKEANDTEVLDKVIKEQNVEVSDKSYACLRQAYSDMEHVTLYTNKSFKNGSSARKVLEYNLSDKAAADREEVVKKLEQGMSLEEATEPYLTDEAFTQWYQDFCQALETAATQ
jgi:multiple sugar transport system substrate-binding protein